VAKFSFTRYNLAFALSIAAVYLYLISKAALMPFVLDEATTFVEFVQTGHIWPGDSRFTTNNHFLNTGLAWVFYKLFGASEFVLRLPNLLAFAGYGWALFSLSKHLKSGPLKIIFVVGMLSSLYIIDFFAMARGYGLSYAFLLMAFAFWLNAAAGKSTYWYAEIALFLAVLANLSIIYVWPAFWLMSFFRDVKWLNFSLKKAIRLRFFSLLLMAPHMAYAVLLNQNFTFDLGTDISILESFNSHISTIYFANKILAFSCLGALAVIFALLFSGRKFNFTNAGLLFVGSMAITIGLYLFLFVAVDAPLPIGRVSLHLFLLWFPAAVFCADAVWGKLKWVPVALLTVLVALQIQDFATNFSVTHHKDLLWKREQLHPELIKILKSDDFKNKRISAQFFLRGTTQYQFFKDSENFPHIGTYHFPQQTADFILVSDDEKDRVPENYSLFKQVEGFGIYANQSSLKSNLIFSQVERFALGGRELHRFADIPVTSSFLGVEVALSLSRVPDANFTVLLCTEVKNQAGETVFWESAQLNHYLKTFRGAKNHFNFTAENLPAGPNTMSVYIWSLQMLNVNEVKAAVEIFELLPGDVAAETK
jgi:hypothetical protein